ncbi:MAG: GNAT family N-acetyltransferase [Halapricum sp.]
MKLVAADEDDVDTLRRFWYALAADMEQYSDLNALAYDGESEVPEDGFRELLGSDDVTVLLLREADEPVGFVTLREGRHPSREYSHYVEIVDLFVKAERRGRGLGTEAIERVKEMARERGCDHLTVTFERGNEGARRLYADRGFEEKRITSVCRLD